MAAGMDDFLTKPIDFQQLQASVTRLLERQSAGA
jgi:DNA-binding response OmpR family regulator